MADWRITDPTLSLLICAVLCCLIRLTFVSGTPLPAAEEAVNGKATGSNGNGNNGNGHEDHWSSLTETQQSFLLHAYFTSAMPQEIKSCERIEECPVGTRCDKTWKICVPKESPHFPSTDGMCGKHSDCKPMYHCANSKCLLTGPLACKALDECLTIPGMDFHCVEIPEQLPGKRCWRRCQSSRDCMECEDPVLFPDLSIAHSCRVPLPFRNSVVCHEGYCKKKLPGQE
ncbi:uncharacterized protein LOC129595003 [Paramacrobiotus metropolitanus]|uniref:uncharacterized protein LOC129595003 n=1 Tax=Paramacrobiotus metropolitanus TaxID=2943436 RepID=UPI00244640A3|nr:uncharacterized protein LOC129595003 [Paramacrobiotus metropolitanus]